MANRVAANALNASTLQILNVIRENASEQYRQYVPAVTTTKDIPKVGDVLFGTPAFANEFLSALVNRIALVRVKSATFNNPYAGLKKGYLEFGETVEEIFAGIIKAHAFNPEKAEAREFKRYIPDVRSAFHVMNYKVQYPLTISAEQLRTAFTSANGVSNLIENIVSQVYTSAEYDEYLLFKYLMIKAIANGKMKPIGFDSDDLNNAAVEFRATSNLLTFMVNEYNEAGVKNNTPRDRQQIFMDARFNAQYDVEVLAAAFNMDKATFTGNLRLIDDWTTFDNERFSVIRGESDMMEEVTAAELALMANVKAVIVDSEWFQVYDNLSNMTDKQVSSGLYWNYFYNVWKTISTSPFANAIVMVDDGASTALPDSFKVKVTAKDVGSAGTVITYTPEFDDPTLSPRNVEFVQTQAMTQNGIAMHKYGAAMIPVDKVSTNITLVVNMGGATYTASTATTGNANVGGEITLAK